MGFLSKIFGGGGGDSAKDLYKQQKKDEEAKRANQLDAIAKLNRMFGVWEGDAPSAPVAPTATYQEQPGQVTKVGKALMLMTPGESIRMDAGEGGYWSLPGEPQYSSIPSNYVVQGNKAYTLGIDPAVQKLYDQSLGKWNEYQSVAGNKEANEARYAGVKDEVRDYHEAELERQSKNALQESEYELARRGTLGGTAESIAKGKAQELYDKTLLDIANLSSSAENQARTADNSARLNAVRDITADVDASTATAGALAQLDTNAKAASEVARGTQLGDVFAELGYLWNQYQAGKARTDATNAVRAVYGASTSPGALTPSYGRVYG